MASLWILPGAEHIHGCGQLPHSPFCSTVLHGPIILSADEFQKLKDVLAEATLLAHPIPNAPLTIMVDASTTAAGAMLHQQRGTKGQSLAFFSETFSPAE